MKMRQMALIAALGGLVLGCKTDPNIPILERELRKQEDEIYKLQDRVEQSKQELEACRRENASLREKAGLAPSSGTSGSSSSIIRSPAAAPPSVQPPQIDLPGEGSTQLPGSLAQPNAPSTFKPDLDAAPPFVPGGGPAPEPDAAPPRAPQSLPPLNMHMDSRPPKAPKVDSAFVEQITLNPVMTGPYDAEGMPSGQGLAVLVETRNVRGQLVRAAAPISVVVLDPSLQGDAARLARWDFSAAQVADMFRAMSGVEGVYLQMRWPAGPPKHSPLEVYVRLVAGDGRKLETHRSVAMDLPSRSERQWATKPANKGGAAPPRTAAKPDGWQQSPPSTMPGPAPLAAEPDAATAPLVLEPQPKLRAAQSKKADAKPADTKAELPVWSPYR